MPLRTPLCDLFGIDVPVIQASFGPWSSVELAAAVSNAGALGTFGTAMQPPDVLRDRLRRLAELTDRPFAVNLTARPVSEEAFELALEQRPAVISYALGEPGELVERAHDAGCLFVHQVNTVDQAKRAAEDGVDAIVAQGAEAAGFGGQVGALALVPQVVDAVAPLPVVAAGGIADGRGFAAALVLGAQGINVGTRFLASEEAGISPDWQRRILDAEAEDAIRVEFADEVFPPPARGGYPTLPRVLRTPFVEEWNARREDVRLEAERLGDELVTALLEGRAHELVPFTGQTAGMVREVLPARELVRRLTADAEQALRRAPGLAS